MSDIPTCREVARDLVAVAAGEAGVAATQGVERHVATCPPCRDELGRYRVLEGMVSDLRRAPLPGADPTLARAELESKLADIRSRMVAYGIFPSPLGRILIARSELGVSMVRYIDSDDAARSHIARLAGGEVVEDTTTLEPVYRELLDYLNARGTRLSWPLDLRWAKSEFQRRVLAATSDLPYGAVASYGGIAKRVGAPESVRAVAQALRHNPLPIVIPCHRVIGSTGDLTGYAGTQDRPQRAAPDARGRAGERRGSPGRSQSHVRVGRSRPGILRAELRRAVGDAALQAHLFGSRRHAEAMGLSPCSSCRPDLHPLPA